MKLKLHEVINLKKPLEQVIELKVKLNTAYKLSKLYLQVIEESKTFFDFKNKAVEKYSNKKREDGAVFIDPKDKNFPKFQKEVNDLLEEEIEIGLEDKLSIEDFGLEEIATSTLIELNPILK